MMRANAEKILWRRAILKGVAGWHTKLHIDRRSLPEGYAAFELQLSRADNTVYFREDVMVDFYGTFITTAHGLPEEGKTTMYTIFNSDDDCYALCDILMEDGCVTV